MSSARRPSRPSSNTWNRPTGPAPTMTASVTVASFVRSGDKGFLQGNRCASFGRDGCVARYTNRGSHVDAARAAEEQAVLVQESIHRGHGLRVFDVHGVVDLRGGEI